MSRISLFLVLLFAIELTGQALSFKKTDYGTENTPNGLSKGDLNDDGYTDLVCVYRGSKSMTIFLNDQKMKLNNSVSSIFNIP